MNALDALGASPVKANRLKTSSLNNKMVNDYWTDVFDAKKNGRLVCWYEGVAINPLMQAADIAWVHGEAWSALLAARNGEETAQTAAEAPGVGGDVKVLVAVHIFEVPIVVRVSRSGKNHELHE